LSSDSLANRGVTSGAAKTQAFAQAVKVWGLGLIFNYPLTTYAITKFLAPAGLPRKNETKILLIVRAS
jgi:Sec-independent protein secretion pathway component TatC